MAATYNAFGIETFRTMAAQLGFTERALVDPKNKKHEIVYERKHHGDSQLVIRIYTSIAPDGDSIRPKGKDAIRLCLLGQSDKAGEMGLCKSKRVNRCGTLSSIFSRISSRARDLYVIANRMHRTPHCSCGAPKYPDSGRCVLRHECSKATA